MKRTPWFFALALCLAASLMSWADGFIIVHEPFPPPQPFPPPLPFPHPRPLPPGRILPPPPRPYVFAPLEVVYHHVNVRIRDQATVTSVDQEFYNPNDRQLEGTYLFPVPKGAQISRFAMEIGGKQVEAELLAADKARKIYEDIVRQMKDPALLEYAGRDVFKVRIFPIEPRAKKRITLSYSQVLRADFGLVNYTYPLNTEKFSARPIKTVSLKLELETKRPLKSIYSPSHTVEIRRHGDTKATVGFESKDVKPDIDFQLFYSTEKDEIGLSVMTYRRGGEDGYFLLLAAPGFETKDKQVVLKDVAFVLDTSGSMAGKKLEQAKKALQFCLENLNEGDRFELVRFSTETEPLFDKMVEATPGNRARANEFIKNLKPTGGTAIDEALQKAFALRPGQSDRPYFVIFLTDGRPTVGNTDEDQIVAGVSRRAGSCRIFCFGIGTDVNTHLLDKITEVTKAVSQYVLPEEDLEVKVSNFFAKIKDPVLANVKIVFPEPMRMTKLYPSPLPDLFLGEQLLLVGRYSGQGEGQLVLEGTVNGRPQKFTAQTRFPEEASEHDFIPRLWATRRVGYLLDEIRLHGDNAELRDEVIELARKFGIVTPYTAYLIVEDEAQRNVPITARSLSSLHLDQDARRETAAAMEQFRTAKSGDSAVAGARYGLALRSATSAADAISLGNFEAQRGMYGGGAMPGIPAAQAQSVIGAATPVRVAQYLEQTRFVNGKNFFQNGNLWTDSQVQKLPQAKRVRIQFGSEQYFDLIAKNPAVSPWLALGQNVQFVLDGKVYEIYE